MVSGWMRSCRSCCFDDDMAAITDITSLSFGWFEAIAIYYCTNFLPTASQQGGGSVPEECWAVVMVARVWLQAMCGGLMMVMGVGGRER